MIEKQRYVEVRSNADGTRRFYWHRKGHPVTRLPDDPVQRHAMQLALNEVADRQEARASLEAALDDENGYLPGTIGWVVARYKQSKDYAGLAPGTKKYYRRFLNEVRDLGPHLSFRKLDLLMVKDFIFSYSEIHDCRKAKAVLGNLYKVALEGKFAPMNVVSQIEVSESPTRDVLWADEEVSCLLEAAEAHRGRSALNIAIPLLRYTAQRPNDCLLMRRERYDGAKIALTQEKTDKLVWVPCHRQLRTILDAHLASWTGDFLVPHRPAKPLPYPTFSRWFAEVRILAKLEDRQPRDFRRTAMVRMSEAGATHQQVAAVSGHTIEQTQKILERYIPRTYKMAQQAIEKWENEASDGHDEAWSGPPVRSQRE